MSLLFSFYVAIQRQFPQKFASLFPFGITLFINEALLIFFPLCRVNHTVPNKVPSTSTFGVSRLQLHTSSDRALSSLALPNYSGVVFCFENNTFPPRLFRSQRVLSPCRTIVLVSGSDQQKPDTADTVHHIKARCEIEENVVESNLVQLGFHHLSALGVDDIIGVDFMEKPDSFNHKIMDSGSSGSVPSTQSTDKGPLWEYGSNSRVRAHLLQISGQGIATCKKVTPTDLLDMKTKDNEYENIKTNAAPRHVPLPGGGQEFQNTTKKRKSNLSPLASAFDNDTRAQLDQEIARMFYTGGLSFNLARNPYYMRAFTFAANHNLGGYVPASYNKLRTTLVQQEKANVERLLQPIKDTWKEREVSIVTDGWSDPQRRPLINFMATSIKVINEIGDQNVVEIITDNAANCKGAGELIEGLYPQIYWTPCVVHTLNLALKNICAARNTENNSEVYGGCHWITEIHEEVIQIIFFIMNHTMRLSMYNKFTPLKLLSVADTRFASIIVMLKRFKLIKRALESLVMSDEWASYREDDQDKARSVRDKILIASWTKSSTPLHCLAHSLNPMYYSDAWLENLERVAPHKDAKISQERMKCFQRLYPNIDDYDKILNEYASFSLKTGPFSDIGPLSRMGTMEAKTWWANFGAQTPLLQSLAFKVLDQPTSSSCSERNWSTYSFVNSLRRNKLTPKRAEDLVFVHNNLRLLSRSTDQYLEEKTKM
ncbi:putative zinc transporter protein [Tanacetum coccineum]